MEVLVTVFACSHKQHVSFFNPPHNTVSLVTIKLVWIVIINDNEVDCVYDRIGEPVPPSQIDQNSLTNLYEFTFRLPEIVKFFDIITQNTNIYCFLRQNLKFLFKFLHQDTVLTYGYMDILSRAVDRH